MWARRPYDPALVDQRSWHDLYGHYGYAPYWAATGVYPPYPSIPLGHSVLIGEALTGRTQTFLSRVLQGLIAGIGFLLAGTILKQQAVGLGREASAVLGTVLAFMILVLLSQVRPYTDTDETRREDTGALQQTAVRAHDKRGQSTP